MEVEKEPAIGISVNCGAIVFQTFLPRTADDAQINDMLDKLAKAGLRQQAKVDIVELRKNLRKETEELKRRRETRAQIEARLPPLPEGRRNNQAAEQKLAQDRANADATENEFMKLIARLNEEIAATEALIAGH